MFDSVLSPSSSCWWRWCCYSWLVDTFISVVLLTGWVWHGSGSHGPLLNLFRNLPWAPPKSRYLISYIAIWWINSKVPIGLIITSENNSVARESSRVILLNSRLNSTGHSACTSEVRDIFDRQTRVSNDWCARSFSNLEAAETQRQRTSVILHENRSRRKKTEFKPVKHRLKIDLVSHPTRLAGGGGKYKSREKKVEFWKVNFNDWLILMAYQLVLGYFKPRSKGLVFIVCLYLHRKSFRADFGFFVFQFNNNIYSQYNMNNIYFFLIMIIRFIYLEYLLQFTNEI